MYESYLVELRVEHGFSYTIAHCSMSNSDVSCEWIVRIGKSEYELGNKQYLAKKKLCKVVTLSKENVIEYNEELRRGDYYTFYRETVVPYHLEPDYILRRTLPLHQPDQPERQTLERTDGSCWYSWNTCQAM